MVTLKLKCYSNTAWEGEGHDHFERRDFAEGTELRDDSVGIEQPLQGEEGGKNIEEGLRRGNNTL